MLTTLKALKDIITKKDVKTKKIFDKISVGVKSRKKERMFNRKKNLKPKV